MHDVHRMPLVIHELMSGVEAVSHTGRDPRRQRVGDPVLGRTVQPITQAAPIRPIHNQIVDAFVLIEGMDATHVWMLDAAGDLRLIKELASELCGRLPFDERRLDREELGELATPGEPRCPDAPHASDPDGKQELVVPQDVARR